MTNTYNPLKTKIKILKYILRNNSPMIAHRIAKATRLSPQTTTYQLNKMVDSGILLKENNYYIPQVYFLNKQVWGAFLEIFNPFVKYIRDNTNPSQMKDDNILSILRMLVELMMLDLLK